MYQLRDPVAEIVAHPAGQPDALGTGRVENGQFALIMWHQPSGVVSVDGP